MRPRNLWSWLAVVALFLAAACAPGGGEQEAGGPTPDEPAEEPTGEAETEPDVATGPIRIGLLAPTTGNFAAPGAALVEGFELFWEEHGEEVAGRPVEILVEDTAGDPDTGVNKAQLLVEQRGVHILVGELAANVGLAIANYVKNNTDIPYLIPVVAEDDLSQRSRDPQIIRVAGMTGSQLYHPAGAWAADQGHERVITIGSDYAFGHQTVAGFVNTFTDEGGDVIEQMWPPLGTQDFGPFFGQIQSAQPDAVFAMVPGGDALRFVQQWQQFGLKGSEIQLIGSEPLLDQSLLPPMGEAALGEIGFGRFPTGRDAENTQEFVAAYEAKFGKLPTNNAASLYTAGLWLVEAIEAINGNVEDTDALIDALTKVSLDETPYGAMRMDEFGQPIFNVYAFEIQQRDDGALWMVPLETFEDVSQFWTYDPQEFLDHPAYSRSYQGDGVWPEPAE